MNGQTDRPEDAAEQSDKPETVEEHQVMGGMGSAVAEVLSKNYSSYV